jgi:hypothetical protein
MYVTFLTKYDLKLSQRRNVMKSFMSISVVGMKLITKVS